MHCPLRRFSSLRRYGYRCADLTFQVFQRLEQIKSSSKLTREDLLVYLRNVRNDYVKLVDECIAREKNSAEAQEVAVQNPPAGSGRDMAS